MARGTGAPKGRRHLLQGREQGPFLLLEEIHSSLSFFPFVFQPGRNGTSHRDVRDGVHCKSRGRRRNGTRERVSAAGPNAANTSPRGGAATGYADARCIRLRGRGPGMRTHKPVATRESRGDLLAAAAFHPGDRTGDGYGKPPDHEALTALTALTAPWDSGRSPRPGRRRGGSNRAEPLDRGPPVRQQAAARAHSQACPARQYPVVTPPPAAR